MSLTLDSPLPVDIGAMAVPWDATTNAPDGTMHAYSDGARSEYLKCMTDADRLTEWGVAMPMRRLAAEGVLYTNANFFALHMYHAFEKGDPTKLIVGERF